MNPEPFYTCMVCGVRIAEPFMTVYPKEGEYGFNCCDACARKLLRKQAEEANEMHQEAIDDLDEFERFDVYQELCRGCRQPCRWDELTYLPHYGLLCDECYEKNKIKVI